MKIYGLDPKVIAQQGSKAAPSSATDFQNILRNQLQQLNPTEPAASVNEATAVSSAPPAVRVQGLTLTEASLNTLEAYSAALANPALSSEALEPFVSTLEEETSAMLAVREQLDQDDPLAGLLEQVATLAYLETAKYQRGDYTS